MEKLYKVVLNVFEANMNISTSNGTFVAYTPRSARRSTII